MALVAREIIKFRYEIKFLENYSRIFYNSVKYFCETKSKDSEEFRVLQIKPRKAEDVRKKRTLNVDISFKRAQNMAVDQDWPNVWPGQKTFHPAVVPLPLRQGVNKHGIAPDKYANAELMKIPNFLHLTPVAIKRHCEAIKKFCTKWPENLKDDSDIEKLFPVEVTTCDYCHSSPSIRDPMARIVSLKVKVKNFQFDKHARDKFLRLVEERYNPDTDYVTITTDSCPFKNQNYEYAQYLLTALVYESWKYEEWEKNKSDDDMEEYVFEQRKSKDKVQEYFKYNQKSVPDLTDFGKALEDLHNKEISLENLEKYKKESLKLFSLKAL